MPQINTTIGLLLQKVLHLETLESRIVQLEVKNSQLEDNFKILSSKFDEKSQPAVVIKSIDQQEQGIIEKGLLQDAVELPNQVQNKPDDILVEKNGKVSAQSKVIDLSFLVSGSKSKSPPSVNKTRKIKKLLGKKNVVEKSPEMILSNLDINSDIEDEVVAENNEETLHDSIFAAKKAKIEDLAYKLSLTQEVIVLLNKINDTTTIISSTKSVKETDQDHDVQLIPVDEISTPISHQMTQTKGKMAQPTNSTLHLSSNYVQSSASTTALKLHSPSLMTKLQIFHQCPVCAKNFANLSSLNRHKKGHKKTEEMLFKCKICQKSFAKMNNYEAHLKTHQPTH